MPKMVEREKALRVEGRELVLCGDINITRTEMDVHPKERPSSGESRRQFLQNSFLLDHLAGFFQSAGGEDIAPNPDTAKSMIDLLNRHWEAGQACTIFLNRM